MLSTGVTQDQIFKRLEVPVQNECISKWACGQIQQLLINPWHMLWPTHQFSFMAELHSLPAPADVLWLPCLSPASRFSYRLGAGFQDYIVSSRYFLMRSSCDRNQHLSQCSPVIFSPPANHIALQTPETKITTVDFLSPLWHVYGLTDLSSGYS